MKALLLLFFFPSATFAMNLAEMAVGAHQTAATCDKVDREKAALQSMKADCPAVTDCRRALLNTYVPLFDGCATARLYFQNLPNVAKCGKSPTSFCKIPLPETKRARKIARDLKEQIKITTTDPERRSYCHYVQEAYDAKKYEACPNKATVTQIMDARKTLLDLSGELGADFKMFGED